MLTFEKVLEDFKDYFAEDKDCEVVLTSRGYTVMFWNEPRKEWYDVECYKTPEDLQDALSSGLHEFEDFKLNKEKRDVQVPVDIAE